MSKFKRVSLMGSEELFRPTRPEVVRDTDEVITEVLEHRPPVENKVETASPQVNFSPSELDMLLEAVQMAKYPDKPRPKPSLDKFGRLDTLKTKLQDALGQP